MHKASLECVDDANASKCGAFNLQLGLHPKKPASLTGGLPARAGRLSVLRRKDGRGMACEERFTRRALETIDNGCAHIVAGCPLGVGVREQYRAACGTVCAEQLRTYHAVTPHILSSHMMREVGVDVCMVVVTC